MELPELQQRFESLSPEIRGTLSNDLKTAFDQAERYPRSSIVNTRRVLGLIVEEVYRQRINEPGSRPLEGLIQDLVKSQIFPPRLLGYACLIRELGNQGAHGKEEIYKDDARRALDAMLAIIEWHIQSESSDKSTKPTDSAPKKQIQDVSGPLQPIKKVKGGKGIERLREINPMEKIPGRSLRFGLREEEVEYLVEFSVSHNFMLAPSKTWADLFARWVSRLRSANKGKYAREVRQLYALRGQYDRRVYPMRGECHIQPFQLSRYPVTNEQFELFVDETGHITTAEKAETPEIPTWRTAQDASGPDHPVTNVSYRDAQAFCEWANVRLPTRDEFERAVRGVGDTLYPWGHQWEQDHCNDMFCLEYLDKTSPVDRFKEYPSSDGVYDLCGNVFEWVISSDLQLGVQLNAGGAFNAASALLGHAAYCERAQVDFYAPNLGFRFAMDLT